MKLKTFLLGIIFAVTIAAPIFAFVQPASTVAAAGDCEARFLGIPPWYRGLTNERTSPVTGLKECVIMSPTDMSGAADDKLRNFILAIALNVIEMAMVIVGYIALFFILYGGFTFITNGSNAAGAERARQTILNAVIGLAIALGAIAILNLIYGVTSA